MKVFVLATMLLVLGQASSDNPIAKIASASARCRQEKNYDRTKLFEIMVNDILPVDNSKFADFFACYWQQLKLQDADGNIIYEGVRTLGASMIKIKIGTDVDGPKVIKEAMELCQSTPKGDSHGLTAIKYRNCLMGYVLKQDS